MLWKGIAVFDACRTITEPRHAALEPPAFWNKWLQINDEKYIFVDYLFIVLENVIFLRFECYLGLKIGLRYFSQWAPTPSQLRANDSHLVCLALKSNTVSRRYYSYSTRAQSRANLRFSPQNPPKPHTNHVCWGRDSARGREEGGGEDLRGAQGDQEGGWGEQIRTPAIEGLPVKI